MQRILVLNGPNLNLLGERDTEIYGTETLEQIFDALQAQASEAGVQVSHTQSNSEGELIDALHDARSWAAGVVFNPAAYTHYSYALRDAIEAIAIPVVEVHLSDISQREEWRKISVTEEVCIAQVAGEGADGYRIALDLLLTYLSEIA